MCDDPSPARVWLEGSHSVTTRSEEDEKVKNSRGHGGLKHVLSLLSNLPEASIPVRYN